LLDSRPRTTAGASVRAAERGIYAAHWTSCGLWEPILAVALNHLPLHSGAVRPESALMEPPAPKEPRRTPPRNLGLLQLIRAKREWHWKPTIEELRRGFRGWHQRGYLPHFDAPNVTQMVTLMLADSFPVSRRAEWEPILRVADDSLKRRKLEA